MNRLAEKVYSSARRNEFFDSANNSRAKKEELSVNQEVANYHNSIESVKRTMQDSTNDM